MSNPAELLYNTLLQWNPPNIANQTAPAFYRQLKSNRDHALRMHEIALGYIAQIRELLDTLESTTGMDVDEFRRELPNWTAMVLSYDNGWNQAKQFNGTRISSTCMTAASLMGAFRHSRHRRVWPTRWRSRRGGNDVVRTGVAEQPNICAAASKKRGAKEARRVSCVVA